MQHFLSIMDLTKQEIFEILNLASELKLEKQQGISHKKLLTGKNIGMIFEKPSTRTRVSFEVAINDLNAKPLVLNSSELQLGRGESVADTAKVLSRYLDCIMIRAKSSKTIQELAENGNIPIINGLDDIEHPCQILADLLTILEYKKDFSNLKICYIGDGNNVANSLIVGALKVGAQMSIATPNGYEPSEHIVDFAKKNYAQQFQITNCPKEAAINADVLVTDVWVSMGDEDESKKRKEIFASFCLNDEIVALANDNVMVQHCLPAHKEEEITTSVFNNHAQEIFDEAENRLHVQKAILLKLLQE